MGGIAELATAMMVSAQRRMTITANNISNISTPSYQARRVFSQIIELRTVMPADSVALARQSQVHSLKPTGAALDIATNGGGVFLFRVGEFFRPASSAQLHLDGQGRLIDSSGAALQAAGGGDVFVGSGKPTILRDGTVLVDGQAVGRIGVFTAVRGEEEMIPLLPEMVEDPVVHQGYLSPSNVDSATEMVELMKAGRLAETGARVFQIYDDLTGRVASKLGELAR